MIERNTAQRYRTESLEQTKPTMSEVAMGTRMMNPPTEPSENRRLGAARSNFGVDDGLLEGADRPTTPGRNFGIDDGLLEGVSPPNYPPSAEDDVGMEKPVSRPRTPINPVNNK